ncbi:MAG: hypothetical protein KF908_12875 [Nitrosomonas sp.]|nr:hypothetical protein [Nitrosomonas sp.]
MIPIDIGSNYLHLNNVRLYGLFDRIHIRQRFESALAGMDPAALGLPPHTLLIVQRVVPAARLHLGPFGRSAAFVQSVQVELAQKARQARRPWLQADTAGAEAVLFADESELMACLLRDWLRGRLAGRWWWRTVLGDFSVPAWWRREVLPRGEVLPAVLSLLASQGEAVAWVARLDKAETMQAIAAVAQAHALPALLDEADSKRPLSPSVSFASSVPPGHASPADARQRSSASLLVSASHQTSVSTYRKLLETIPELQSSMLTFPQRRLLAVALGLQRAPAWVRSAAFEMAMQCLEQAPARMSEVAASGKADPFVPLPDKPGLDPVKTTPVSHSAEPLSRIQDEGVFQQPVSTNSAQFAQTGGAADIRTEQMTVSGPTVLSDFITPASPRDGDIAGESAELLLSVTETRYGGIFYLLNVALALGLYGDFTQPRNPGIALSPWDWLALIGRAWFGRSFERDAVWRLLAGLAGRPLEQPPGRDFAVPDVWTVPAEWLKPWGEVDQVRVYATRTRLQIWHAAGFVIADTVRDPAMTPLMQAFDHCAQHEALSGVRRVRVYRQPRKLTRKVRMRSAAGRWMGWFLLYLNARLARALGEESGEGNDMTDTLAGLVCCHAASMHCTAAALDVYLSLAELPIALRIAGLDRDPGWIPVTGRTIAFHFE